jgi:hypothetical protein
MPLLIISAQKNALRKWGDYQKELAALSVRSKQMTFSDVSHLSMLAHREHAVRVVKQIEEFVNAI